jgi:hypothetical protein
MRAIFPTYLTSLDLITLIIFGEEYNLRSSYHFIVRLKDFEILELRHNSDRSMWKGVSLAKCYFTSSGLV